MEFKNVDIGDYFVTVLILSSLNKYAYGAIQDDLMCYVPGFCTNSTVIGYAQADIPRQCLTACQDYQGCHWFSFKPEDELCLFLDDCQHLEQDNCQDCVSGQAECPVLQCDVSGLCIVRLFNFPEKKILLYF